MRLPPTPPPSPPHAPPAGATQSRVLRGLAQPLAGAAAAATLVCAYESALQAGRLPDGAPSLLLPAVPFDLTGGLLSLLLVFRRVLGWGGQGGGMRRS